MFDKLHGQPIKFGAWGGEPWLEGTAQQPKTATTMMKMTKMIRFICFVVIMILSMIRETSAFSPRISGQFRVATEKSPKRFSQLNGSKKTVATVQSHSNILIRHHGVAGHIHASPTILMMSKKQSENVDDGITKMSFDGIMFPPGLIFVAAVVWPVAKDPLVLVAIVTAIVALYNLFLLQRDD